MNEDNERRAFEEWWDTHIVADGTDYLGFGHAWLAWLARARVAPKGEPVAWRVVFSEKPGDYALYGNEQQLQNGRVRVEFP